MLKPMRANVREGGKNRAGSQQKGAPPSRDKTAWELTAPSDATYPQSANNLTPPKTMSAGCCDADSPWLSWSYWFEPLRGYTRGRSQAEQEMIEACTTPRSGRTSFDE